MATTTIDTAGKNLKNFTKKLVKLARKLNETRAALENALPTGGVIASGAPVMVAYVEAYEKLARFIFIRREDDSGSEIQADVQIIHYEPNNAAGASVYLIKAITVNGMVGDPATSPNNYSSKSSSSSVPHP